MQRNVSMEEISDGRLYESNDMVKADCGDCKGCSACCSGMGSSIVLDPKDVYHLQKATGKSFEQLLNHNIELNVFDGIILPNLKMSGQKESCTFLTENGRCSIHENRPGICRMFPLGRYYENDTFKYFLQIHECKNQNRTKIKVKKWLGIPNLKQYEDYILEWHRFLQQNEATIIEQKNEAIAKNISMTILKIFYMAPYDLNQDFYEQFYTQMNKAKGELQW